MFLLNGLVVLLFDPRAIIYPYVWVILPLAIFLSGLLVTNVRLGYLALAGVGALFLNANVTPQYLSVGFEHQIMPLNLVGNLFMTSLLIIGLLRPRIMFPQTAPSQLWKSAHTHIDARLQ